MPDEILVNVSMRFPNLDPNALGEHLTPLVAAALKAGGISTNISIQKYDPDDDDQLHP